MTMIMQNFGMTNEEYYGMLWYFLEWSIKRRIEINPVNQNFFFQARKNNFWANTCYNPRRQPVEIHYKNPFFLHTS